MRSKSIIIGFGIWLAALSWTDLRAFAAGEGLLPLASDAMTSQDRLPPGATQQGAVVLHKISSTKENLHLLAGYYYGNPRLWKKIYADNRTVIKNPNRLPVGQTIRIHVGEGWQPKFAYQEWFNLAIRNGEWAPGQARKSPVAAETNAVPPAGASPAAPAAEKTPPANTAQPKETAPKEMSVPAPEAKPAEKPVSQPTPAPPAAAAPEKNVSGKEAPVTPTPPTEKEKPAKLAW